jgi:hypothetical protein
VAFKRLQTLNERGGDFKDLDRAEFKYNALYFYQIGCSSPLSYTLDADVAFTITKQAFTNVRIVLPEERTEVKLNGKQPHKTAIPRELTPNALCVGLTIAGIAEEIRSCKKIDNLF